MNNDYYYQEYLRQIAEEQARQQQGLDRIKGYASGANTLGNNLSVVGNAIKDNVNNEMAQKGVNGSSSLYGRISPHVEKFGGSMANFGGNVSNGATAVNNTLNAPQNYFKGFANNKLGNAATKVGQYLAQKTGFTGALGNGLTTLGSSLTGAGATGAAAGGAAAGTAAGTAAGGAAAGGAASGAAAGANAVPGIGTLVALGIMAAAGTNRKRAKKAGTALMDATNNIVNQESDAALQQTQQNSADLQAQAQQALSQGVPTGAAASVGVNGVSSPDVQTSPLVEKGQSNSISDYQDYLRGQGYSDSVINGVPQGLNGGNQEIADWINQYNNGAGKQSPIRIPQSEEEIAAAKSGSFNTPVQSSGISQTQSIKDGLLNKFLSGIGDFTQGYQENRNNAFTPENLSANNFYTTQSVPSQDLVDYQNKLRNNGVAENVVNAVAQGKNSGNKNIADWIKDNPDALKTQDVQVAGKEKSNMARLGEAAGTIGRMVTKPAVQALLAGGISTALTGNPLYGAGMAYNYGKQRALSNIYENALKNNGINVQTGMLGQLGSSDMNTLMTPHYKQQENDLKKVYYDALADYRTRMAANAENKTAIDKEYKAAKAANDTTRATASMISANKKGTSSRNSSKSSNASEYNQNLAKYMEIVKGGNASQIELAKKGMTAQYGSKFLTDSKKIASSTDATEQMIQSLLK